MPITVVGSIAYDTVKTPFGERERMLGRRRRALRAGGLVLRRGARGGPGRRGLRQRAARGPARAAGSTSRTSSACAGGRTFFWHGEYGWDLNSRETHDTQLGVFEGFAPKLSERSRSSDVLFLANIQPELQREVRAQLPARPLRGARLDEPVDRNRARVAGGGDHERRLRDPQRRRAAPADGQAEPGRGRARDPRLGARRGRREPAGGSERGGRQAGRVRGRAGHRARASSRCPPTRWRR